MKKTLLLIFMFCAFQSFSQDIIKLKNGEEIQAKITVVKDDEIQYKEWSYQDGPDFVLSTKKIEYVRFQNGRELRFEDSDLTLGPPDNKAMQRKNVIKFSLLSPLFGRSIFGYEKVQRFGLHWEGELGIIGLGNENSTHRKKGLWIAGGPKLLLRKETYMRGERYLHYLQGSYVRPEITVEYHNGEYPQSYYNGSIYSSKMYDYTLFTGGVMMNLGKQWFVGDVMTIELYFGAGLVSTTIKYDKPEEGVLSSYYRSFSSESLINTTSGGIGNGDISLGLKGGFKIGIAFAGKKKMNPQTSGAPVQAK
ncbi:MAG: hypothetical protein ACKVOK_08505 [Flavobacteriales bacterium]